MRCDRWWVLRAQKLSQEMPGFAGMATSRKERKTTTAADLAGKKNGGRPAVRRRDWEGVEGSDRRDHARPEHVVMTPIPPG